ncbi:MAG: guanylate kinase [Candidatus Dadabacteria bacterium]|nr:guanylate kinase [Candidatus Dadabacteria bacterium]
MQEGILFVISGPSGSGKTTLVKQLLSGVRGLRYSISYTTRKPRPGERDGVDYKFINERHFEEMIANGEFAEWANVYGNLYGTPLSEIEIFLKHGSDLILEVDEQGVGSIKKRYGKGVYIFIAPPSLNTQTERLRRRKAGKDDRLDVRLKRFNEEMENRESYDYIIVNDDLDEAVEALEGIVIAERKKR